MTTPASNTPFAVINDAYFDAALKQLSDDLNGEQLANGMRRLCDVINFSQTTGLKMFAWQDVPVPLTAGTAVYTFLPGGSVDMTKPLRVLEAFYLYTATNVRRPLSVLAMRDYYQLGQAGTLTSNRGTISQYYVEKLYNQMKVTFWQCPDDTEADNGAAHVIVQGQIANVTELDETIQFPAEWRMFLRWALAYDLATGQPQAIIDRCEKNRDQCRMVLEDWDVEDAPFQFTPDPRASQDVGGFR